MTDQKLNVSYQKYYDQFSPWFFTPTLRKQNRNLELKTGVQIKHLEKVQKIWLKHHRSDTLKLQRDLQQINKRLDRLDTKSWTHERIRTPNSDKQTIRSNVSSARNRRVISPTYSPQDNRLSSPPIAQKKRPSSSKSDCYFTFSNTSYGQHNMKDIQETSTWNNNFKSQSNSRITLEHPSQSRLLTQRRSLSAKTI
uniref:Uncharacterized protein n=1 Tax=Clytia hemisphaerica TaxID=252671 RepID=A0A7M5V8Q1_9CNID